MADGGYRQQRRLAGPRGIAERQVRVGITINTAGTLVITYSNTGGFQANAKINGMNLAMQARTERYWRFDW